MNDEETGSTTGAFPATTFSSNVSRMKPLHIMESNPRKEPLLPAVSSNDRVQLNNTNIDGASSPTLSLFWGWLKDSAWPGMGLFGESYLLFSIGTLQPIWEILYPNCFSGDQCSSRILHSTTYSVVLGIICGMIVLGRMANSVGRRRGSIITASFMAGGATLLTLVSLILSPYPQTMFICMSVLLFLFGFGVGGEYPLSASSASEKAMGIMNQRLQQELEREQQRRNPRKQGIIRDHIRGDGPVTQNRGQKVQLVFTMQGMGILLNSVALLILLLVFGQTNEYDNQALLSIWRITYGLGALILICVLVSRVLYLRESEVWQDDKARKEEVNRGYLLEQAVQLQSKLEDDIAASFAPAPLEPQLSTVSSLSAQSYVINEDHLIRSAPTTSSSEDLQASRKFDVRST